VETLLLGVAATFPKESVESTPKEKGYFVVWLMSCSWCCHWSHRRPL
jgi:hypothetical protein